MTQEPLTNKQHNAVQMLLPWYATGRLEAEERATVDAHLRRCARCQGDLALERRIVRESAARVPSSHAGWVAMLARLDAPTASPLPAARPPRERRRWLRSDGHGAGRRLRWVVAGQSVAIAILATWMVGANVLGPQARQGEYRALSADTQAPAGNVLVMFKPTTPENELRKLLTASGARLVNGPTSAGAYVLMLPGGADGRGLATLRSSSAVTMAEPIEGESQP